MVYDAQIVEVKEYTSDVAESAVLKMTPKQSKHPTPILAV